MPTDESVIRRLREGKSSLRRARLGASIEDKLRELVQAQHLYVQIAGSRRTLQPWQQPWGVLSDVKDSVVIGDDSIEARSEASTSSQTRWVRPSRRWEL